MLVTVANCETEGLLVIGSEISLSLRNFVLLNDDQLHDPRMAPYQARVALLPVNLTLIGTSFQLTQKSTTKIQKKENPLKNGKEAKTRTANVPKSKAK